MTPEQFRQVESIFRAACEQPSPQRAAFVARACGDDAELRAEVTALLEHDARPAVALHAEPGILLGAMRPSAPPEAEPDVPEWIGPYRVIRKLGEGGFGVVYLAEQQNPRRSVALKVLRVAFASSSMSRRFEYEAHILGRLRHPGIAQIYEAGVTRSGATQQPFFAMEYVRGANLVAYAESARFGGTPLGVRQRLELFLRVCAAVQHAHQCGVIHRDLKPENILVDDEGRTKVVDFGVARTVDAQSSLAVQTGAGQLLGTLGYMSPEQVSGDPARIDTRSDVYGLGVILFQLLTGRLPHDVSSRSLPEAVRVICQETAPRIGTLRRELRGDLEAIVGRALEKDPERRYPSVSHLAGDIDAHLTGRTVAARPASMVYRFRKLAARHTALISVAALAVAALVLGVVGTTWQAVRATRERDLARSEARKAQRVSGFLQRMLASVQPNLARGRDLSVRDLLDQSAARVHDELGAEPDVEAAIRSTIGETYVYLGRYEDAETQLRTALQLQRQLYGPQHAATAATAVTLAQLLQLTGREGQAFELCEAALAAHAAVAGKQSPTYARTLMLHADLLRGQRGDFVAAEAAYREVIAIYTQLYGGTSEQVAAVLGNLGSLLFDLFRIADAEPVMRQAYDMAREVFVADNSVVIMNANNYAALLLERGRVDEAEPVARAALACAERLFGPQHPESSRLMTLTADVLLARGDPIAAEQLARCALECRLATFPSEHLLISVNLNQAADALAASGDVAAAIEGEALAIEALAMHRRQKRENFWWFAESQSVLGACLRAQGRYADAEALLLPAYEKIRRSRGARSHAARAALQRVIALYDAWERGDCAAQYRALLASTPPR